MWSQPKVNNSLVSSEHEPQAIYIWATEKLLVLADVFIVSFNFVPHA